MSRKLQHLGMFSLVLVAMLTIFGAHNRALAALTPKTTHVHTRLPTFERGITSTSHGPFVVITPKDIWVAQGTTFQHYDGSHWYTIASPSTASPGSITSMAAVSSKDIWAVGNAPTKDMYGQPALTPLIEHWDGEQWSRVPTDNSVVASLNAVIVVSANDVWAVGTSTSSTLAGIPGGGYSLDSPIIEHFDGSRWQRIASPVLDPNSGLSSIAVITSTDIWATGPTSSRGGFDDGYSALIEHYDGQQWMAIHGQNVGFYGYAYTANDTLLTAISSITAKDIWAVGTYGDYGFAGGAISEHWDGKRWSLVSFPEALALQATLTTAIALHTDDVWAMGTFFNGQSNVPLVAHWDGTVWSEVKLPDGLTSVLGWQQMGKTDTIVGLGSFNNSSELKLFTLTKG